MVLYIENILRRMMSVFIPLVIVAMPLSATSVTESDTVSADFFRTRMHSGDLVTWMQGFSDYVTYEGNYQGQWSQADQMLFSINGNSPRWNKFYIDGFRTNSRLHTGSTLYVPNMEHYDMSIDVHSSTLSFTRDTTSGDYLEATGNIGGIGGINPTTVDIVHLFHGTGTEGAYNPAVIDQRQHIRGAGTLDAAFTIGRGRTNDGYRQHIYAAYGNRQLPQYDQNGLFCTDPLFGANYYKLQADGYLPVRAQKVFDRIGYLLNISGKKDGLSEFYYNREEQPDIVDFSTSIYGKRQSATDHLTTGLTWSVQHVHHSNLSFERNIIDQDGESLEPWMPDGQTYELSWSINWQRQLLSWLTLNLDTYNSLIGYHPSQENWSNQVYLQHAAPLGENPSARIPLYTYQWHSNAFAGGLLENSLALRAHRELGNAADVKGHLGLTFDAMLLDDNSKATPNVEAGAELNWHPCKWLDMSIELEHRRIAYDLETMRFMSEKYLTGHVFSADNPPSAPDSHTLLSTTGGGSHSFASASWQPAMLSLFIPVKLRFGRHEIALLQSYKKFYHTWMVQYAGGASANGSFVEAEIPETYRKYADSPETLSVFYATPGAHQYEVGYIPSHIMGGGFLTGSPYYIAQQTRYSYFGRKFFFSLSWQSMLGAGPSPLGGGPGCNTIGVLSETTANPNTQKVLENASGEYPAVGRYDQDRAYIARLAFAYNINEHIEIGANGSWTDGQPFAFYHTFQLSQLNTAGSALADSPEQLAILNCVSRGINPTDGNFGCRESAIFHIDVHARFSWKTRGHATSLRLQSYNAYDHGNVLNEMCFPQGDAIGRGKNFILTIPRGVLCTLHIQL